MRAARLGKNELAVRLGWTPTQVKRLFDGRHAVRFDQVETALATFGRRLVVTSVEDYRAMAAVEQRESEALEWVENLTGDIADEPR